MIHLATLPPYYRTPKGVHLVIWSYNLACHPPGKGNRARRRQGLYVHNPDHSLPFGCIAMDRGQIARMMRTPPNQPL